MSAEQSLVSRDRNRRSASHAKRRWAPSATDPHRPCRSRCACWWQHGRPGNPAGVRLTRAQRARTIDPSHFPAAKSAGAIAQALASREFNDYTDADGTAVFQQACKMGLEGIVSKRPNAGALRPRAVRSCVVGVAVSLVTVCLGTGRFIDDFDPSILGSEHVQRVLRSSLSIANGVEVGGRQVEVVHQVPFDRSRPPFR
jgi:hypothetical protein